LDTREEMLHVKEDLRRLIASQNRLMDRLQCKDNLLTVRAHLLGYERIKVEKLEKNRAENVANLVWLTRTTIYLRDKAERLRRTWEDADSLRVDELFELNGELTPPRVAARDPHQDFRATPVLSQASPVPDGPTADPRRD
jgi:acetone carboxylase gamma subunit